MVREEAHDEVHVDWTHDEVHGEVHIVVREEARVVVVCTLVHDFFPTLRGGHKRSLAPVWVESEVVLVANFSVLCGNVY